MMNDILQTMSAATESVLMENVDHKVAKCATKLGESTEGLETEGSKFENAKAKLDAGIFASSDIERCTTHLTAVNGALRMREVKRRERETVIT